MGEFFVQRALPRYTLGEELPETPFGWKRRKRIQDKYLLAMTLSGKAPVLPNGLRVIRMFCDHGVDYPLWESFTDQYVREPEDLGLSTDLASALYEWHQTYLDAWDGPNLTRDWEQRGWQLHSWLSRELEGVAEVRPEFAY